MSANKRHWTKREKSLAKAIKDWADDLAEKGDWGDPDPYITDDTWALMAAGAVTVLRGVSDGMAACAEFRGHDVD